MNIISNGKALRYALGIMLFLVAGLIVWMGSSVPPASETVGRAPRTNLLMSKAETAASSKRRLSPAGMNGAYSGAGKGLPLAFDRAALEAADASGELLGTYGTSTPEELLFEIVEIRGEPFAPLVLDKLEEAFRSLKSPADRIRAAALLHRYGHAAGTDYLRNQLQQLGASAEAFPIAATLAMARDKGSLEMLVDGMGQFARDPEFARAAALWADLALMEKARALIQDPKAPRGILASMLAMVGDPSAAGLLSDLAAKTPPQNPFYYTYQAALVRLGSIPADSLLKKIEEMAENPARVMVFLPDVAFLLGADRVQPLLENILKTYTARRFSYGEQYDQFALKMQNGSGSIKHLPTYPSMAERRMFDAVSVLQQWKIPSTSELIYNALEASQKGRYSVLMNRQLMAAATEIDPDGSAERFRTLGFQQVEIEAATQLTKLMPVAQIFFPRQKSIAITKASQPEPPN